MNKKSLFLNELLSGLSFSDRKAPISRELFNSLTKKYEVDPYSFEEYGVNFFEEDGSFYVSLDDLPIDVEDIKKAIDATHFFSEVKHFFSVDSTNTLAKELALSNGVSDGLILISEYQSGGRGRFSRKWFSAPYRGIYVTFLLRPFFDIEKLQLITLVSGLSVKRTILDVAPQLEKKIDIKWPNDVNIFRKKICGVLTESISSGNSVEYIAVGVGVNVNQESFNPQIERFATSLLIECGRKFNRTDLLVKLINYSNLYFEGLKNGKFEDLIKEWESESSYAYNKKIKYFERAKPVMGVSAGLDENGYLKIRKTDGEVVKIVSGEIFEF